MYLDKIDLDIEVSALIRKENKEEKGDLEKKIYVPHLGATNCLITIPKLGISFLRTPSQ